MELHKWQQNSDGLQKDSLRLKKQLAVVTERRAQAEKGALKASSLPQSQMIKSEAAQDASREEIDQLQMRLADGESLGSVFAVKVMTTEVYDEGAEPIDLSECFGELATQQNPCPPVPELPEV